MLFWNYEAKKLSYWLRSWDFEAFSITLNSSLLSLNPSRLLKISVISKSLSGNKKESSKWDCKWNIAYIQNADIIAMKINLNWFKHSKITQTLHQKIMPLTWCKRWFTYVTILKSSTLFSVNIQIQKHAPTRFRSFSASFHDEQRRWWPDSRLFNPKSITSNQVCQRYQPSKIRSLTSLHPRNYKSVFAEVRGMGGVSNRSGHARSSASYKTGIR